MEKTKTRLENGFALQRGDLVILIRDNDPDTAAAMLAGMTRYDDENAVTPASRARCENEIRRLQSLMERITNGYPDTLDIFEYLPLTKQGKFSNAQNTLVADSACTTANLFDGGVSMYPRKQTIQLRLMPYYDSDDAFIQNQPMDNVRELRLDWYDSVRKAVPVFDADGNPSRPETTRASYLRDADIRPGFVYEEKSGTRFLALEGMQFCARYGFQWPGKEPEYSDVMRCGVRDHIYVRWTKKLETALDGARDFNTLFHILADGARDDLWLLKSCASVRENPRKFVREVGAVLDPTLTRTERFATRTTLTPAAGQDRKMWLEYSLFEGNRIPTDAAAVTK